MRMQFRIWHLFLFTLIAALAGRAMMRVDAFPIATKTDAARVNAFNGELVEMMGDEEGPYKYVFGYTESMPVDKSAPNKSIQRVHYKIEGQTRTYLIPTGDDSSTHVNVFQNSKGNHFIVVFETLSPQ